ncbi:acyl-CoA dehydrogenase [Proteobacteria bacterium 005FR1]|nr:acyl-CoA dehydrogenase [Proteobacteria bacterium 005FR1]
MGLIYNEEQQQLQDSAREFLAARSPVAEQRRLRDEAVPEGFSLGIWKEMLELGWGGIAAPEQYGGLEFGFQGFGPVFEEIGRHLSSAPLLSSVVLSASLLESMGSEQQREKLIPELINGQRRLALALDEDCRFRPERVGLKARKDGDYYVLDGKKTWVVDGFGADGWLTVARLEDESLAIFLVDATVERVQVDHLNLVDSRNHAALTFDEVRLPAEAKLPGKDALLALETVLDRGTACLAAELLGMSESLFERTVDYLKTRVQFGVPIGSFQALQHRAARLYVDLQLARSAVLAAFECLNDPEASATERSSLVSLAKWKAGEMAHRVSNEAVQMHGGIGVTDELDVGLYLKRIRVVQVQLGDSDYHCERYAATLR